MPEDYLSRQESAGFKVGDRVIVTGTAHDHEDGWYNSWPDYMNNSVGKIFTITLMNGRYGIRLNDPHTCSYPYFVLKKIEDFELPDYIKVGAVLVGVGKNNCVVIESIGNNLCKCREHEGLNRKHYDTTYTIYELSEKFRPLKGT